MDTTLTRYQPQSSVTRLPDLVNRLFNESFVLPTFFDRSSLGGTVSPTLPVNLFEIPDGYIMQVALPGLKVDSLDIRVAGREVTIEGEFQCWTPENGTVIWNGIPTSKFYETFALPVDLESDNVEATYENGIVQMTLPKAQHLRPRAVKVQVKQ